jgi:hypothetical protein
MLTIPSSQRFLAIYSGILTLVFVITVLCGFSELKRAKSFDEITVHRINIVEPDGTIRMILSNKNSAPGAYIKNEEYPHDTRQSAGLLFFDDEGTEDGGLIYGLSKDRNGRMIESNVHLSFDKYMQDQIFTVDAGKEGDKEYSELTMQDRGDFSILEGVEANHRISKLPADQQAAEWEKYKATHPGNHKRVVLGRSDDGSSVLRLKDRQGRDRIVMQVAPDGAPTIQILGPDGKAIDELPHKAGISPSHE